MEHKDKGSVIKLKDNSMLLHIKRNPWKTMQHIHDKGMRKTRVLRGVLERYTRISRRESRSTDRRAATE